LTANATSSWDRFRTHLELGRVSNLPTVWSNVFTGAVLAAVAIGSVIQLSSAVLLCLMLAMSTFYIAGMYLNDACDAELDALERPNRPIPSGRISRSSVILFTCMWFAAGWLVLLVLLFIANNSQPSLSLFALCTAAALNACIVLYDFFHKQNPFSPAIMGLCRVFLIACSYFTVIAISAKDQSVITSLSEHTGLLVACCLILLYLCGLTFIAKFENSNTVLAAWPIPALLIPVAYGTYKSIPNITTLIPTTLLLCSVLFAIATVRGMVKGGIPKAIGLLIAGISLIDAIIMSVYGSTIGMTFGIVAFFITLLFQRKIAGT